MFKSLSQKTAVLFTLCFAAFFALVICVQTGMNIYNDRDDFSECINKVFTQERIKQLESVVQTPVDTEDNANQKIDRAKMLYDALLGCVSSLELGLDRSMSVLNGNGNVIYTSDCEMTDLAEKTPVVAKALVGETSMSTSFLNGYSDYALSIKSDSGENLIIYILDTHGPVAGNVKLYLISSFIFLIFGIAAAFFIGTKIAKDISEPVKQLTRSAKKLSDGDINTIKSYKSETEIKELSETIVKMAHSIEEINVKAKREQNKLETILQNMTDGILAFDLKGKLIHINHEAQRVLKRNYLENANFDTLFKELKANISIGDLLYINHDDEIMERQVTLEGDTVIRMTFTTFSMDDKISGIVVVVRDITDEQKLEASRKNFVADVSHELRTPLTTIKSYSETLIDNPDTDRELSEKFLKVIGSEADRMVRIISDLLTLSQLDAKSVAYKEPEIIDVRKLVEAIVDKLTLTAKKKEQKLNYNPINEVPQIMGDRDALERVIINIIGNALKYTPSGGVIDVYTSKVYNDICINVTDNGIGIPKENLPHIFDRFYRVDKARSRDTGGTGLGLAIAKQTIESAFSGKIMISSELNKGTEVIITIPVPEN